MKYLTSLIVLFGFFLSACAPKSTLSQPTLPVVCSTATPITQSTATSTIVPTQTNIPTLTPQETEPAHHSVFLISWDAGRADLIYGMMSRGLMPNFANLAANGIRAEYAQTIDPSLTAPAHNSMSTGSYPNRTGIVSNAFHNSNDSFYWYRKGFTEPLDKAEPIWVTASRAGLTSAALFFPGGTPSLPLQTADYTIGFGERDAYSKQQTITLAPPAKSWQGTVPQSFSPPFEGAFVIPKVAHIYIYMIDSSDDNLTNYDSVLVNTYRSFDNQAVQLRIGDWGSLILDPVRYSGADFLLQSIDLDENTPKITLYHTSVNHNIASPRQLLVDLNENFGFYPAEADDYALKHGWITDKDYLTMLERASLWKAKVSAWVYTTYEPDLLMTWQNNFDSAGHVWLLTDTRQNDYSPEKSAKYIENYQRTARIADQALELMLDVIDLETTTLMMVADHGMSPIYTTVYVNTLLEKAGLLKLDRRNYVIVKKSKAFAVASGGAVNIYINLIDREESGIVTNDEYPQIQADIVNLLSSLTDPETGEPVFSRVLPRDELSIIHLDHPNSGDVFAQANPGYNLDGWRGKDDVFAVPDFYGQHGYESTINEMRTIFIAAGAQIPQNGQTISHIKVIDYAPTIAALLGFDPASTVDGIPIASLLAK